MFRRQIKTVYATNLSIYVIHYSFYFIQDTSAINAIFGPNLPEKGICGRNRKK